MYGAHRLANNEVVGAWQWAHIDEPRGMGIMDVYPKAVAWLDLPDAVLEDWGCGTTYAKQFVKQAKYVGIDGSKSQFNDVTADLRKYRSEADCILSRGILEHNWRWEEILDNMLASFQKRMVLVNFLPFSPADTCDDATHRDFVPYLNLDKRKFMEKIQPYLQKTEHLTEWPKPSETLFYLERDGQH